MAEDFNKLKMIAKRAVRTNFQQQWEWKVGLTPPVGFPRDNEYGLFGEGAGGISDFDLLAKSIDHDPVTIETEQIKAGGITFNFPTGASTSTISLTMRDALDEYGTPRFYQFFKDVAALIVNDDGTVNLRDHYLMTIDLLSLTDYEIESYRCFPQKLGNWSASVDGPGLVEYPVTFMQFRSLWKGAA